MTKQNRYIPNPNKISDIEERFVKKSSSSQEPTFRCNNIGMK